MRRHIVIWKGGNGVTVRGELELRDDISKQTAYNMVLGVTQEEIGGYIYHMKHTHRVEKVGQPTTLAGIWLQEQLV